MRALSTNNSRNKKANFMIFMQRYQHYEYSEGNFSIYFISGSFRDTFGFGLIGTGHFGTWNVLDSVVFPFGFTTISHSESRVYMFLCTTLAELKEVCMLLCPTPAE